MQIFPQPGPERKIRQRLIDALRILHPAVFDDLGPPTDRVGRDAVLLEHLLSEARSANILRVWDSPRQLVVSRRLARLPGFPEACAASVEGGWPVAVRASGGTTVVHRPGVINISLFLVDRDPGNRIVCGFDRLCALIVAAGCRLGLSLHAGRADGSYCDGAHNVCWEGRKLAGTAGVVRRRGHWHARLFHASVTVDGDVAADVEAVQSFERSLGLTADYSAAAHISLAAALDRQRCYCSATRSSRGEQPNFAL